MTQPGSLGNIVPRNDGWFGAQIRALWAAVRKLQTARAGNAMTVDGQPGVKIINGGALGVYDGGSFGLITPAGVQVVAAGQTIIPDGTGRTQQVFVLSRDDGTRALVLGDGGTIPGHPHLQALTLIDHSGNVIFAEDSVSGTGLATPYIPAGSFADITLPTATTTSGSYTPLQWADCYQQHPRVTASVLVNTPAGTAGTIRLLVGSSQIGSAVSIPGNTFAQFTIGPAAWPSGTFAFGQRVTVELQARVTGGAGAIGVRCLGFWGIQS